MWPTIDKEREALPITVERVDRQSYFLTCIVQYANLVHRISKEEIAGGVQNGEVNGKMKSGNRLGQVFGLEIIIVGRISTTDRLKEDFFKFNLEIPNIVFII